VEAVSLAVAEALVVAAPVVPGSHRTFSLIPFGRSCNSCNLEGSEQSIPAKPIIMKLKLILPFLFFSLAAFAQSDEEQVKAVVNAAYVQGIHNGGPVADIRQGFHPSFNMLRLAENEIRQTPIEEWITNIEKNRAQSSTPAPVKTEGKFIQVSVAGTAANVVLELYRADKKIFTDNLLLYKFNEGWRIVGKTFYRHP
jgi:hypothetical protein